MTSCMNKQPDTIDNLTFICEMFVYIVQYIHKLSKPVFHYEYSYIVLLKALYSCLTRPS